MPFGVPMNKPQPLESDSAGRTPSFHKPFGICATSSSTTPASFKPRTASKLSEPKRKIVEPFQKLIFVSDSRISTISAVLPLLSITSLKIATASFKGCQATIFACLYTGQT